MNLIIVEDEYHVAQGIAHNIPWDKYKIHISGIAMNGEEALLLTKNIGPDIILLDIQMPKLDGIGFMEFLRIHLKLSTKVIILSAHDDFHYMKSAIDLSVFKYLLKPAGDKEILSAVLDASQLVRKEKNKRNRHNQLKRAWESNLPRLQELFLYDVIFAKYPENEILCRSKELGMDILPHYKYAVSIITTSPEQRLFTINMKQSIKQIIDKSYTFFINYTDESIILLFVNNQEYTDQRFIFKIENQLKNIMDKCCDRIKTTFGTIGSGYIGVTQSFQSAEIEMYTRLLSKNQSLENLMFQTKNTETIKNIKSLEKQIEIILDSGNLPLLNNVLNKFLNELIKTYHYSEDFYETSLYMSTIFIHYIQSKKWSVNEVISKELLKNLRRAQTFEQLILMANEIGKKIVDYMHKLKVSSKHQLINEVLLLIEKNIEGNLKLSDIAATLYTNPSYLSRLFKQEMKVSFSEYTLDRKMKYAKELLLKNEKVYVTAKLVGYQDVSYFTNVFREYWGVTPGKVGIRARD